MDFYLPPEGCSYRIAVVSIKILSRAGKRIVMGILSFLKQFLYTKFIIVVDDDINVRDWKEVMWAMSTRMEPVRDTIMIENAPIDYLDFASLKVDLEVRWDLMRQIKSRLKPNESGEGKLR